MHMAFRVQSSLASTDRSLEASARVWFEHYGADQNQKPTWMSVLAHLRESNIPEWVWDHESQIVRAQLAGGQPVSPNQSAMLMQDFARGVVEAKLFVDKYGAFHMSLGVPMDCISSDEQVMDVPVVFRYYTETHAMAAVCTSFTVGNDRSDFTEDWQVLDKKAWGGMTVGKLLKHIPFMKGHFKVEWHAAQSVQEVLQRDGVQFPSFIRQMSRVGQDGAGVGGEQINSNYLWYMESWEMKIKAGGGRFDKRSVAKMMQLPLMPSKDSKILWAQLRDSMDLKAQEKI